MKASALIAAAALTLGTAAFAADDHAARVDENDNTATAQQEHGHANAKMRGGLHRLGEKTRHAMHRLGDKMHHVAHNERADRHVARNERTDRSNDTRAMGASGDNSSSRQARMDEAYSHWQARHDKAEHSTVTR